MPPTLTPETIELLLLLADDEVTFGERTAQARRAIDELRQYQEAVGRRYVLCQDAPYCWQIGAGEGMRHQDKGAGSTERGRGLALLEIVAAWPLDPVRVADFLDPAIDPANVKQSAATMLSRTRAWIAEEADIGLGELLKAVTLSKDAFGNVVAIYAPGKDAPPILTSYRTL